MIQYSPPCAFRWFPACHIHPPSLPRVFRWLLWLLVDWGPPKTTTKFVFLIFLPLNSTVETMRQRPPPSLTSCTPSPQNIFRRLGRLSVGWYIPPSTGSHRKSRPRSSIYFYFFVPLFDPPKRRVNVLPHTFRPVASPLQHPIPRRHHRSVDCCVSPSRGRHPRLVSAHLSIFWCVPLGCPNQSIPPQRAQAQARPWRMIRWRGRAKPLGVGRCSDSSCVFVCLFVRQGARPQESLLIFYFCTYFLLLHDDSTVP